VYVPDPGVDSRWTENPLKYPQLRGAAGAANDSVMLAAVDPVCVGGAGADGGAFVFNQSMVNAPPEPWSSWREKVVVVGLEMPFVA
jgi:hypothetical protein